MRKLSLFFCLVTGLLVSCRKERPAASLANDPSYKKAKSFLYQQNDSAFYYFNQVTTNIKDSLQTAMAYNYMAFIQSGAGDYFGSQESLSMSLRFLDTSRKKDRGALSSTYNELGLTSLDLKNYDAAINFFDRAIQFSKPDKYQLVFLNNKALAYQKKGTYPRALKIYRSILPQTKDAETHARILTNLATTQWLSDPAYNAAPELLGALHSRQKEKDDWGQNSSYAHLADFFAGSRPDSSWFYAVKMYAVARKLNSPDDELEALEKMIKTGPSQGTKRYFTRYQRLSDSLQTARNAAKNQFAFIRYEVEKNKADNLKLQKDNTEKRYLLIQQNIRFYGILAAFMVLSLLAVLWYRKRKRQQELETQEAVRETQRKASKKVHDTLANDIYRIMKIVQHEPALNKDALVDDIDEVYQRARDISYEIMQGSDEHFHEQISALLKSFASEDIKVVLVGNSKELWQKVDSVYKLELKYVLQELMVNMQKHSRADNVVIKFALKASSCHISYFDNGVGIPNGTPQKNGLENTGNRIKSIGGQITFDSDAGKGLQILIAFPTT